MPTDATEPVSLAVVDAAGATYGPTFAGVEAVRVAGDESRATFRIAAAAARGLYVPLPADRLAVVTDRRRAKWAAAAVGREGDDLILDCTRKGK